MDKDKKPVDAPPNETPVEPDVDKGPPISPQDDPPAPPTNPGDVPGPGR